MIKNLSATDMESSSDSGGGTNGMSRGPWAGFKRRLSNSGELKCNFVVLSKKQNRQTNVLDSINVWMIKIWIL